MVGNVTSYFGLYPFVVLWSHLMSLREMIQIPTVADECDIGILYW